MVLLSYLFLSTGLRAVAHLWQEFVLEMRYRWENDIFIPRYKNFKTAFCVVSKGSFCNLRILQQNKAQSAIFEKESNVK